MLKMAKEEESIRLEPSSNDGSADDDDVERSSGQTTKVFNLSEVRRTLKEDFGLYEIILLILTQLGYIPVAAAMMLNTFLEPSKEWCAMLANGTETAWVEVPHDEYYSLSVLNGHSCQENTPQTNAFIGSLLMWGALVGSFVCGVVSDNYGRRPVYLGSLFMVSLCHVLFALSGPLPWYSFNLLLLVMGFFCGGYMVTNFVIITECFELARSRLLVVSVNGWSVSMVTTGVIAWWAGNYVRFHGAQATIGFVIAIVSFLWSFESCRWLSANGKPREAKRVAIKIVARNDKRGMPINEEDVEELEWFEILGLSAPMHHERKSFRALFESSHLLKPTAVMCYSFLASSIVSFGFYFSIDILPGNRYVNTSAMGLMKFILGVTPFFLNRFISKRVIAICSVGLCCFAAVLVVPTQYFDNVDHHWILVLLSLVVSAGIDPTWKINHLYSAELFPTSVRSMARGVCNAGGRLGSVLAPMIVFLRIYNPLIPNIIFAILLFIQLVVIFAFLPNDDDSQANEMNDE